jgi:hypothetical protein
MTRRGCVSFLISSLLGILSDNPDIPSEKSSKKYPVLKTTERKPRWWIENEWFEETRHEKELRTQSNNGPHPTALQLKSRPSFLDSSTFSFRYAITSTFGFNLAYSSGKISSIPFNFGA